jgi:glycosyltransferase involved in cell wall biosynthesis
MRLACVVQRYGPEITGGSEAHCRHLAERLAAGHQVDVLTSCATDYLHWRNTLPTGWSTAGPVRLRRFEVARPRRMSAFVELSHRAFGRRRTPDDEREWFRANGPEVPGLLDYLQAHGADYDLVLFWAFRYFPSYFGVPIVRDRAVLVPTAEDDAVLDFTTVPAFLRLPRAYLFLTDEERTLVTARAGGLDVPSAVVGTGLEPAVDRPTSALDELGLTDPFVVYVGRVDRNKGCEALVNDFARYVAEVGREVTLVLAGPVHIPMPSHPRIRVLGFVSEAVREALFTRARALVMPSPYESLCMALLEGWNHALPAIVNGHCAVLRGQVERSNGGLHYGTSREFAAALSWVLEHPDLARQLGRQGLAYVDAEYRWPTVMSRVERLLGELRGR